MKTTKIIQEIRSLRNKIETKNEALIQSFLKENPEIKKFSLEIRSEYDDNNNYNQISVSEINGQALPNSVSDSYDIEDIEEDYNKLAWNKFFMASRTKIESLASLINIINEIDTNYFENKYPLDFELKKPKKSEKEAK